jgi:hypothetical protein
MIERHRMRAILSQLLAAHAVIVLGISCSQQPTPPATSAPAATSTAPPRRFPTIGIAVSDDQGGWCAEFPRDAAHDTGQPVTLVFHGASPVASVRTRIGGAQPDQCHTEFPQPRWENYRAYRLQADALAVGASLPSVALAVSGDARWDALDNGVVQADLDGDGILEHARRCAADEGEHFTIWSVRPQGQAERRAHEYFDWGANVDPTCRPGEDGR